MDEAGEAGAGKATGRLLFAVAAGENDPGITGEATAVSREWARRRQDVAATTS